MILSARITFVLTTTIIVLTLATAVLVVVAPPAALVTTGGDLALTASFVGALLAGPGGPDV